MTGRDIWRLAPISEGDVYNSDAMDSLGAPTIDIRDWRKSHEPKDPTFSRIINPADWEGVPVPPRKWIVLDYIPDETVTMLAGDGGTGKSLLAMQLAVGRAVAREWIGLLPEPGRTLILSAEDDADEMHRRLDDIRKFYGARMDELGNIRLVDLVGEDSILGQLIKGQIQPAPMYHALDAYMCEFQPGLTALDVLADIYVGDENSRSQVRQFVGLLKKLARKHNCAILLLSHPSVTGMNSGSGASGSTGWNNSVRSRLYFQTAKTTEGTEPDVNLRTLQGMKSNYGVRGGKVDKCFSRCLNDSMRKDGTQGLSTEQATPPPCSKASQAVKE